jgi:tetratricopeptide (TPR) repeat protein
MRFHAALGSFLVGLSSFAFPVDGLSQSCSVHVAMADGSAIPKNMHLWIFRGDKRLVDAKIPETGTLTVDSLQPGNYRAQIGGGEQKFLTSGPLDVAETGVCTFGIDLDAHTNADKKIAEEDVDVEDLRVSGRARSLFSAAFADFQAGKLEKSKQEFLQVTQMAPRLSRAYNVLGVISTQQNQKEAARQFFERALELNPRGSSALMNLAKLSIQDKEYAAVVALLERHSGTTREVADAHALKAEAYLGLGKFEQAIAESRAAHALPHSNWAYVHLISAGALERLGQQNSALQEYRTFLQESHNDLSRTVAIQRIHDLTTRPREQMPPIPTSSFMPH